MKTLVESAERWLEEDTLSSEQSEGGTRVIGKEEFKDDTDEDLIKTFKSFSEGFVWYMNQINARGDTDGHLKKFLIVDIQSLKNISDVFLERMTAKEAK